MASNFNPYLGLLLAGIATASIAQNAPQPPLPPNQQAQQAPAPQAPTQPKSGLGQQAKPQPVELIVPMPKQAEIVSDSIDDIEDAQLTDAQYQRLKQLFLRKERQKATPYASPAKPITRTLPINLDPGVSPPVLRLSQGQLTSVVFSDVTGQPWNIQQVVMNRQLFSDGREGQGGSGTAAQEPTNVLTIDPLSPSAYGSVSIRLKGLTTPVIFVLTSGQQEVDLRVDAKVSGHNPDAVDAVSFTSMPTIDVLLSAFLDGVPPKDARRLKVSGLANTEAWLYQENLYLRTNADAQYPAYLAAARSTSGKAVYRFASRHNSVTLLTNGRAATVFIEE
ncbi:intracellular multiplication protein IcmK [Massilia sp. MP_M2]|uniref:DotH/IcmK family type IV secretion protein n=1 Tax=Massilia sp. MP_M2 TaxID=3071713 RepID=UPI00319E52FC